MGILKIALLLLQLSSGEVAEVKSNSSNVADDLVEIVFTEAANNGDIAAHGVLYISGASGAPLTVVNSNFLDCGYMGETARNFGEE